MTAKSFERELQLHERIAAAGGAAVMYVTPTFSVLEPRALMSTSVLLRAK